MMENKIITDWLDKHGNPEIYKKVEDYIEKTNMEDEYIIINKTDIQQKIEELEQAEGFIKDFYNKAQLDCLKQILSQSTPLIPEIEKAYFEGECYGIGTDACVSKQDYISNLKLDI